MIPCRYFLIKRSARVFFLIANQTIANAPMPRAATEAITIPTIAPTEGPSASSDVSGVGSTRLVEQASHLPSLVGRWEQNPYAKANLSSSVNSKASTIA